MRSLEDLERAFERGLNAWESGKVLTVAGRMGLATRKLQTG